MIIFFGGAEIFVILFIFIAVIAGSAEAVVNMIGFFVTIFAIKNIIQTVILGFIKNKNPLSYTVGFLVTDIARMAIFFHNLSQIGMTFADATGMKYFTSLFSFILYFLICGGIFLFGEFISLLQAFGKERAEQTDNNLFALLGGIGTVVVLAVVTWIGYL